MCDVVMVPYDISFLPEYNAVALCYTIFNCLIRSHSYITYKGSAKGTTESAVRCIYTEILDEFLL